MQDYLGEGHGGAQGPETGGAGGGSGGGAEGGAGGGDAGPKLLTRPACEAEEPVGGVLYNRAAILNGLATATDAPLPSESSVGIQNTSPAKRICFANADFQALSSFGDLIAALHQPDSEDAKAERKSHADKLLAALEVEYAEKMQNASEEIQETLKIEHTDKKKVVLEAVSQPFQQGLQLCVDLSTSSDAIPHSTVTSVLAEVGMNRQWEDAEQFLTVFLDRGTVRNNDKHSLSDKVQQEGSHTNALTKAHTTPLHVMLGLHCKVTLVCSAGHVHTRHMVPHLLWHVGVERLRDEVLSPITSVTEVVECALEEYKILDYTCVSCGRSTKVTLTQTVTIMHPLPPFLVILLKRWRGANPAANRVDHDIKLEATLQVAEKTYILQAVVLHHFNQSHYTTYAKRLSRSGEVWLHYNDDQVTTVPEEQVLLGQNAYLLFYRQAVSA